MTGCILLWPIFWEHHLCIRILILKRYRARGKRAHVRIYDFFADRRVDVFNDPVLLNAHLIIILHLIRAIHEIGTVEVQIPNGLLGKILLANIERGHHIHLLLFIMLAFVVFWDCLILLLWACSHVYFLVINTVISQNRRLKINQSICLHIFVLELCLSRTKLLPPWLLVVVQLRCRLYNVIHVVALKFVTLRKLNAWRCIHISSVRRSRRIRVLALTTVQMCCLETI